jgi:hypothetical protein
MRGLLFRTSTNIEYCQVPPAFINKLTQAERCFHPGCNGGQVPKEAAGREQRLTKEEEGTDACHHFVNAPASTHTEQVDCPLSHHFLPSMPFCNFRTPFWPFLNVYLNLIITSLETPVLG